MLSEACSMWPAPAVFMGMGEPLLNLRAVSAAAAFLVRGLGIGARHVTLSTVGVPNAIGMLADTLVTKGLQITLAVSLHAPNQALRQQIVPRCAACRTTARSNPSCLTDLFIVTLLLLRMYPPDVPGALSGAPGDASTSSSSALAV